MSEAEIAPPAAMMPAIAIRSRAFARLSDSSPHS
jgi:hypothetical protein